MARILGRSKSFRLKPSQKELISLDSGKSTPLPPDASSQIDLGKLKDAELGTNAAGQQRVETPDSLQRPRTSNGPEDRGRLFHKKVAPVVLSSNDQETFNFPIPSQPSPKPIMYAAEVRENGTIGMALGSPTMPQKWNHNVNPHATDFVSNQVGTVTHISYDNSIADSTDTQPEARPKISRWKSLFGKKSSNQPQQNTSFYQLQQTLGQHRADSHHDDDPFDQHAAFKSDSRITSPNPPTVEPKDTRKRSKSIKNSTAERAKAKAEVDRMNSRRPRTSGRDQSPPTPPKDTWRNPTSIPKLTVSNGSENASPRTIGGGMMLDVDIPKIEMERYSVMFGSLLKPDRSSNLFIRRQGNAERLKPLTELTTKSNRDDGLLKPVRRATSPSLTKSPTFSLSLFPKPAGGREDKTPSPKVSSLHRPRPLHRSNTAPATSPHRQTFARPDDLTSRSSRADRILEDDPQQSPEMVTQILPPTPSTRNSFDSESEEVTVVVAKAPSFSPPREREPDWEIVSKPKDVVSPQEALASNPVHVNQDANTEEGPEKETKRSPQPGRSGSKHKKKVSVGVARTVSVSRAAGVARRDLMRPMVSTPNLQEVLVDKKPLTPTLVELKNRKSQRVQLVDA